MGRLCNKVKEGMAAGHYRLHITIESLQFVHTQTEVA